jgi:5-oxoprolinase (ATP-hydrolysing)
MANAIKFISVQRGHDVTEYTLACFGGAGGQHACLVADELGMKRVYIHPLAGVLSAYGMGLAQVRALREEALERRLDARHRRAWRNRVRLGERRRGRAQGAGRQVGAARASACTSSTRAPTPRSSCRWLDRGDARRVRAPLRRALQLPHAGSRARRRGGVGRGGRQSDAPAVAPAQAGARPGAAMATVEMTSAGAAHATPVFEREQLAPGQRIAGPAIIAERNATTVVEPEWEARVTGEGTSSSSARCRASRASRSARAPTRDARGVQQPLHVDRRADGRAPRADAYSVNIKERLDFSCALFDADGNLIANAPHMPVHLGSMGESIKTVIAKNAGKMKPGDVYVLNDPYNGGTHLAGRDGDHARSSTTPDREILFYVTARAATIATRRGSRPARCRPSRRRARGGRAALTRELGRGRPNARVEMRRLLRRGSLPRAQPGPEHRRPARADRRQREGRAELRRIVAHFGLDVVKAYMRHVAGQRRGVRAPVIGRAEGRRVRLRDGQRRDDPREIAIGADRRSATIDFTGTSAQLASNFNAPAAVGLRGGAVRVPHARGRRHPAQRRMPQAAEGGDPGRLDAQSRARRRPRSPATSRPRNASRTRSTARSA